MNSLTRRGGAEFLGTALLLMAIVGAGIAAQRLSPHQTGLELFEVSTAAGAAFVAIILAVGPVSGAHLNPAVSLADRVLGGLSSTEMLVYWGAQIAGGVLGTIVANLMFSLPPVEVSTTAHSSPGLWLGEVVATFGLVVVIFGVVRSGRASAAPFAVGAYIASAFWFTSSTSFANPAVTVARELTNTFAGISPASVPPFLVAQVVGAMIAVAAIRFLYPSIAEVADQVVVPRA